MLGIAAPGESGNAEDNINYNTDPRLDKGGDDGPRQGLRVGVKL
ncbi:hypothetical protein [Nocardia jiangxiensis]|nr:hypothetical protein [Nocardia jiangxiensis]